MIKFTAESVNGRTIEGTGIAKTSEKMNGSDRAVMILFTTDVDWVDGAEFNAGDFEFVWADTVAVNFVK